MDITKKGGYPIWYILSRDVKQQKLSLNDATQKATKFLAERDFKDLVLFESTQYDNTGVLTFVRELDNVRIYPESIKMKVALDNGQIIGFSEEDYLKSLNTDRKVTNPQLSLEQARDKINPQLKVMEDGLAVIVNDLNKEVLCYEFLGTLDNDTYRIFINADTGIEEKVERMNNAEPIYEKLV
jgi:spore germination protein